MNKHDPITRFTPAEQHLIDQLNSSLDRETALAELKKLLQVAVQIELATIPIYLYTYYSINRTVHSGENMRPSDVFANKTGGMIMSVAVEEMLHMSLSANILYSLGEMPKMYQLAPDSYPTVLPAHHQTDKWQPEGADGSHDVAIPLGKLDYSQLWHFLQIEYPETMDAVPENHDWKTIGQVYSYVRCIIATNWIEDEDFRKGPAEHQIQSFNYSPNNTDTVHTKGKFDPWEPAPDHANPDAKPVEGGSAAAGAIYSNEDDSHAGATELVTIHAKEDAYIAIDTICDQGEGYAQPHMHDLPTDDPSKHELSHYYKFLTIQAQLEEYKAHMESGGLHEQLPKYPAPPAPVAPTIGAGELAEVVIDYPDNPVTLDYPEELQPISDFCNGVFQYMLVLTETLYLVPPQSQRLFFNEGMHRSMIWVLDKLIKTMRDIPINNGKHKGKFFAPTFENIHLGPREGSFATLNVLGKKAIAAAEALIVSDPSVDQPAQSVIYYVEQALSATDAQGAPQHLPDVKAFWDDDKPAPHC
ncbi:ferritin-like domain-containing protein [Pontixanthobacter aestiaquae]|uniref:Iminophenyl-pyruvate dimer synthase domain-containing protein n=1 Tax=Pontixanthobacter aestiaquae TaxID=1509367 RepID=A0A844Z1F4_9SPHN|nr:ferritin-like domain-containing protein [Pontixanthobacter aestiaquae]MDN3647259.1 ferritin-like domain-containing protein [Pontixanthobacter aestiaquae]MXO81765.1 hypothetical protein [Pontixanthobacter aestiaquae]